MKHPLVDRNLTIHRIKKNTAVNGWLTPPQAIKIKRHWTLSGAFLFVLLNVQICVFAKAVYTSVVHKLEAPCRLAGGF